MSPATTVWNMGEEVRRTVAPASDAEPRDDQLVELCRTQLPYSTEAFEILARRYGRRVFNTCWRILGNREDAEEATQDVFLRTFHGLPGFEGRSSFRTWLFRIVSNVCAKRRARQAHEASRRAEYEATLRLEHQQKTAGGEDSPLSQAMERITPEDRQVIVLRYVSELSLEEIAGALGLTLSATKMRLYRAVERFRGAYREAAGKKDF